MTDRINKLHRLLFLLLLVLLPTQLGKHFWPDWSMVNGLRVDYLSPTVYLTDMLIVGILINWIVEKFIKTVILRHQPKNLMRSFTAFRMTKSQVFLFFCFSVFLLLSCFLSQNQPAAFYKLIKIIEFSLLVFYVSKNSFILNTLYLILPVPIIYSSLIAIAQFLNQGSLGEIFYWLGERTFNGGTPGIAQAVWNGHLMLRPYATFPHPNVLAGFLVVGLLLLFQFKKFSKPIWTITMILGIIALFLTFSRVAWVVFGVALLIQWWIHCHSRAMPAGRQESGNPEKRWILGSSPRMTKKIMDDKKRKIVILPIILLFFCFFVFLFFVVPIQPESISYRQDLNSAAIKMWQSSPLVGVGLNNFLVELPKFYQFPGPVYFLQPAHNLFLMVLAETGIIGLIGLIWFLILTFQHFRSVPQAQHHFGSGISLSMVFVAILALSLFDHYFYTLQQGQLLFSLVLGLAWSVRGGSGKIKV